MIYFSTNFIEQISNHSFTTRNQTHFFSHETHVDTFNFQVDDHKKITFEIKEKQLLNQTHLFFAEGDSYLNSTSLFHTKFLSKKINLLKELEKDELLNCEGEYLNLPSRIFAIFGWTFYLQIFYYIALLLLCVYFRDEEPLKSRSFAPFVIIFCHTINLAVERVSYLQDFEWNSRYGCILTAFLRYPPIFTRYLFILNINLFKVTLSKKVRDDDYIEKMPLIYIILKRLSSPMTFLLLSIFLYFGCTFSEFIALIFYDLKCLNSVGDVILYVYIIPLIFANIFVCFLFIFDITRNIKILLKCKLKLYFVISDPNFFRYESMLFIPNVVIIIIWTVTTNVPILFRLGITEYLLVYNVHLGGIFALYVTIFYYFYRKIRNKKLNDSEAEGTLSRIFNDPFLLEIFSKFANSEWSIENVLCKSDIMKYQKHKTQDKRLKSAYFIRGQYLLDDSPFQINIDSKTFNNVAVLIDNGLNVPLKDDLFDPILKVVHSNLSDTLSRFTATSEYKSHLLLEKRVTFVLKGNSKETLQ
eukprot:gene9326-1413_t